MSLHAITHLAPILSHTTISLLPPSSPAPPSLTHLAPTADPILHIPSSGLTSLLLPPTPQTLLPLLSRLSTLSRTPVVLHVLLSPSSPDLSTPLLLKSALPYALYSETAQQAADHTLLASRLALHSLSPVLHIVHPSSGPVDLPSDSALQPFLSAPAHAKPANGHSNGHHASTKPASDPALESLYSAYDSAALSTLKLTHRAVPAYHYTGPPHPSTLVLTLGASSPLTAGTSLPHGTALLSLALLKPWPAQRLLRAIPESVETVVVLEQVWTRPGQRWGPVFVDVVGAMQGREEGRRPKVLGALLGFIDAQDGERVWAELVSDLAKDSWPTNKVFGTLPPSPSLAAAPTTIPPHEQSYVQLLETVFPSRLSILNDPSDPAVSSLGVDAVRPEHALGRAQRELEEREAVIEAVRGLLRAGTGTDKKGEGLPEDAHAALAKWIQAKDTPGTADDLLLAALAALRALPSTSPLHPSAQSILSRAHLLQPRSRWILNSDSWSYDLGQSGLHHLLASGANVNLLLLDTTPYTTTTAESSSRPRKKDAGLYALNRGDVYVASVAVYASYGQVLQALVEADSFPGPSIVLAYLPYGTSHDAPALDVLRETKKAVDAGAWPLYRWDPRKEEPFELDSEAVKADLREFLDRQNHLSLLERKEHVAGLLEGEALGEELKRARQRKAKEAYEKMLGGMEGERLLVLYASDGGVAEKLAKRLAGRARARGLGASVRPMDEVGWEDWAGGEVRGEGYTVFVTSTAGQGEPPQNGRNTFKEISAVLGRKAEGEAPLEGLKYAVFGLGDSHYWPRPEDAHYYNKPSHDLDARLAALGASRIADLGLGDDQDADGPETGYKAWEPVLWRALGVGDVEVLEAEPEPITNEYIKIASNFLRGTIAEGLKDESTGALAPSDGQLTKFHGIYEQDDRDIRDERKDAGLEPAYAFMIRVRMPGGVCRPEQWTAISQIADEHGNGTFKLTTRQTFQFHGVIKRHLKPAIQDINKALLDTIAACGDVNRGVLCSAMPAMSHLHAETYALSKKISEHLMPRTSAYHEIWLDKKQVAGNAVMDMEPLYGPYYLPRKFKIAIAVPPHNDVDVFCNDLGFIAIADDQGHLSGYNVSVGGGMGVTHSNKKTYPRLGSVIGFCKPEEAHIIAEKIMLVQRDNGNRQDRKNARLKYTIDRMGLDVFKAEVEKLLDRPLEPARPFSFDSNIDKWGWQRGLDGKHHFTMFIENGRVQDEPGKPFKTGLREIAGVHKGTFRLTANQHLILADIAEQDVPQMKALLAKYKLDNLEHSALRLSSSACVAFPTCGLAMAESERYLPVLIDKVEKICEESGLRNDEIVMRMTGCPNGCARPYVAEVAFVGKAPGSYLMLLGGGFYGQRLNKIYRETVSEPEILAILKPMIKRYALEREEGERFGDWTIRAGYIDATTSGNEWYEGMGGNM